MDKPKNIYQIWKTYGLDLTKIQSNQTAIRQINIRLLWDISIVVILLTLTQCWFPLFIKHSLGEAFYYFVTALISFALFLMAGHMKRTPELVHHNLMYRGCCMAFMHLVLCFGIFVGVISNTDKLAGIYFMLLLWVQVLFILSPKDNLFVGLLSCGVFSVLSFRLKEPSLYIGDILNCFVAFIISQASNWILGRQRIQKIIAQNELHGLNEKLY